MFLMLTLYCVPALMLMLILDAVPLQDPGEGWSASSSLWLHHFVCIFITVWTVLLEGQLVVPG